MCNFLFIHLLMHHTTRTHRTEQRVLQHKQHPSICLSPNKNKTKNCKAIYIYIHIAQASANEIENLSLPLLHADAGDESTICLRWVMRDILLVKYTWPASHSQNDMIRIWWTFCVLTRRWISIFFFFFCVLRSVHYIQQFHRTFVRPGTAWILFRFLLTGAFPRLENRYIYINR